MPQSYLDKVAGLKLPAPMQQLVEGKARRCDAVAVLDSYLDKAAAALPPPRRYAVRVLQSRLAAGDGLFAAVKVAYGLADGPAAALADNLARKAAEAKRAQEDSDTEASREAAGSFSSSVPTRTMSSFHGPVSGGRSFMASCH